MKRDSAELIAPDTYWIGAEDSYNHLHCNTYLIIDGEEGLLIDPGPVMTFPTVAERVRSLIPIENLRCIALLHQDPDVAGATPLFEQAGFRGMVAATWRTSVISAYYGITSPFYLVEKHEFRVTFNSGNEIEFLPAPYLHFPGAAMAYDPATRFLFSGDLFGAFTEHWSLYADDAYIEGMEEFHREYMPSNEILRPVMESLLGKDIAAICPQHGSIIARDITRHITALRDLQCGLYIDRVRQSLGDNRDSSFLINLVLEKLISAFGKSEIIQCFADSRIGIDAETGEAGPIAGPFEEIWNSFFNRLYACGGHRWLAVAEPLIDKLSSEFAIRRPDVFYSALIREKQKSSQLSEEKKYLEAVNASLRTNLDLAMEEMTRDQLTGLYNENFLVKYLLNIFNESDWKNFTAYFVQIDHMRQLNQTIGEQKGNELIAGVGSLLQHYRKEEDYLFRIGGPVFVLVTPPEGTWEETEGWAEKAPLKRGDRRLLAAAFVLIVLTGPLLYIGTRFDSLPALSFIGHMREFAYEYNFFFAFYSMAVNSIYLILLVAALFYLIKQLQFWKIHSLRFLFSPELLPSISILAPAFNEDKNIVNNVKSLLNLHYPDFEVIVINDGSKDRTIDTLIDHFFLERSDKAFRATIATEPVRGVYTSSYYPNLTVIDKSNGGKADSLNAGINLATKDFICTIDSDSLLEHDALTKIAYQSLLTDREPVAMGGNILPANGCSVRNGRLVNIKLGRSHLVRFQTIEYMRSFLAGRLGWSFFNSMVIISGAFGLFLRRRVVEIGGYLTPKSRMHAGTVGEDMELVVRLHEHLGRKGVRYRVFDAFNANCWTEVPETFKILHRQRDRWHRGLIESVLLHKKMLGNPRFGAVGLLAFPYFFLFELIGPFLEFYGYVNLFISIGLGIIDARIAMLLFFAVIMYGMLISIGSLIISENEILYFNTRETVLIVLYGILENFGFRQIMSMIRVTAYVTFMFKEKSWGVMERKGLGSV